ncbi:MAG: Flp pilus assembly complex ATPase component TadA [Magnetococcales bacterium]|nr:Flp pilus assembly complex ATPase component TadA [Magnetococcales bacterium]
MAVLPPQHYLPSGRREGRQFLPAEWLGRRAPSGADQSLPHAPASLPGGERPVRRVGDLLLERGLITPDQLEIALTEQERNGEPLGRLLVAMDFVSESSMRDLLSEALAHETVDSTGLALASEEAVALVPKAFARRYSVVPLLLDKERNLLVVAMSNTLNVAALDKLQARLPPGLTIQPKLAGESEVAAAIDRVYGFELSVDGILREIETGEVDLESLGADSGEFSYPMVRLVNALLTDAVKNRASDLHVGPMAGYVRIRYRIDGVLRDVRSLHSKFYAALVVRFKVMSGMDIAETRRPQDGHCSLTIDNRKIDFRVSVQPTSHGENVVLRVLDRKSGILKVENLGLPDDTLATLRRLIRRPEGILLVTGPTGSGKTTTLYSLLDILRTDEVNIMTLEDPVEYPMSSILQTEVNRAVDLDFTNGIRSILRQDPDVILVGEIRDVDTAEMALRAAMTGHQVLSTLHSNSALGAIPRLLNIGLKPDMLAGNMIGVLAQRLMRKLCLACRRPLERSKLGPEFRGLLGKSKAAGVSLFEAVGCSECGGTGYKGRMSVMEILPMDTDFDDLISRNATIGDYRQLAVRKGFRPMALEGRRLVESGLTSIGEYVRVLGLTPTGEP